MMEFDKKLEQFLEKLKQEHPGTYYHSVRVKRLVYNLLSQNHDLFPLTAAERDTICKGALLHDIGKCYVKNVILTESGSITAEEKEHLKQHTVLGAEEVKKYISEEESEIITSICRNHHERLDGSGYFGLTEIPPYMQAVSVCDVFDALTSDRVYRKGFSLDKALEMMKQGKCGAFSPQILKCLEAIVS